MGDGASLINSGSVDGGVVGVFGSQRVELRGGSTIQGQVDVSQADEFLEGPANDQLAAQLSEGESVAIDGSQYIGFDTINKTGAGTLRVGGTLTLTETAQGRVEDGYLELNDGAIVLNELLVSNGGALTGNGTVIGDLVVQGGSVGPGFSPGSINVDGDVVFESDGILQLEFAGLAAGEFDFLEVTGSADISGAIIELVFIESFLPSESDTLEFLTAASILGIDEATFLIKGVVGDFDFSVFNGGLSFIALTDAAPVPLPSSLGLLLFGIGVVMRRIRL